MYTKMFAAYDHAHKNRVLMSLCTRAQISAKMPLCQAVYKIQIRTNPLCLMSTIGTFNLSYFLKQYHVSWYNIGFLCPSYMLHFERASCMFLFWLWQGCFRTFGKISMMPELKENHTQGTASTSFPGPDVVTGVSLHITVSLQITDAVLI